MPGLEEVNISQESGSPKEGDEQNMVMHISPFHVQHLKEAEEQLTAKLGKAGLFDDETLVRVAADIHLGGKIVSPQKLKEIESQFLEELHYLREHPDQRQKRELTFEQSVRQRVSRRGKPLREPSGWTDRREQEQ